MANKQPTISLVIPAHNEAAVIKKCLDSVQNQTKSFNEIIVVDNNSTDSTKKIASSYKSVRVVDEPSQGSAFASSAGFGLAASDLIARIDADTILPPDWVQIATNYFADHPKTAAITGKCYFYNFPLKKLVSAYHASIYHRLQGLMLGKSVLWASNMAIRREVWTTVKPYCHIESNINEDIDLTIVLKKHGYKIVRLTKLKAHVSLRRGDLTVVGNLRYLYKWPANYFKNGLYIRGSFVAVLSLIVVIVTYLPAKLMSFVDK